jgi:uncharacterized alpha-E superfamily protein
MALLSRVAESLFWMGRYVERAENTARLLDVTYHGRLEPHAGEIAGVTNAWQALLSTLGLDRVYQGLYPEVTEEQVIEFLTVNRQNSSSMASCIAAARENARGLRDYLSSETWVAINRLYHSTSRGNIALIMSDGVYDFCDMVRQGVHLFAGTAAGTSLHDEGYHWMQAGEMLERADMVTRIVDSKYHLLLEGAEEVGGPLDRYQWAAVLRGVSGYEAYRRTHVGSPEPEGVVDFLILSSEFPRSLRCSLDLLAEALDRATEGAERALRNAALRLITDLQNEVTFTTADALLAGGLHEFIVATQARLRAIGGALLATFFGAAGAA